MSTTIKELTRRKPRSVAVQGTRIFAYKHFQTNQVVYSLSRVLNNASALKQLPFSGKQSLPTALRKDHWKPYFTVKFPLASQGLVAYKKLREWRKLHEYSWNKRDLRAFIEKQTPFDKAREEEKAEDYTTWSEKRTMRKEKRRRMINTSKFIHDQKANSVADLAAVLVEQDSMERLWRLGLKEAESSEAPNLQKLVDDQLSALRKERADKHKLSEEKAKQQIKSGHKERSFVQDIAKLMENPDVRDAKLARLSQRNKDLLKERAGIKRVEKGKQARKEAHDLFQEKSAEIHRNRTLAYKIMRLETTFKKLYVRQLQNLAAGNYAKYYEYVQNKSQPSPQDAVAEGAHAEGGKVGRVRFTIAPRGVGAHDIYATWGEVLSRLEPELRRYLDRPSTELRMKGVVVEWADTLDAEHAERWPEVVHHKWMGLMQSTTPPRNEASKVYELEDRYGYDEQGRLLEARGKRTKTGAYVGHKVSLPVLSAGLSQPALAEAAA